MSVATASHTVDGVWISRRTPHMLSAGRRATRKSPRSRGRAEPVISFSELDGIRYLHFGSPWVQGAMRIRKPNELVLSYIRDMMGWLLFLEPPARILQLGLGAAALTKFCHRHCRRSETTVVEISRRVVEVAEQWFALPATDERLQVVRADAFEYLDDPLLREGFGVIQVDLYDQEAAGPVHDSSAFYRACHRALAEPGILVVNLFGRHASFDRSAQRIRKLFPQVFLFDSPDEGNMVLLALKGPPLQVGREQLLDRADVLKRRYRLPAERWAEAVAEQLKL